MYVHILKLNLLFLVSHTVLLYTWVWKKVYNYACYMYSRILNIFNFSILILHFTVLGSNDTLAQHFCQTHLEHHPPLHDFFAEQSLLFSPIDRT